ncbi:MAG: replication initiation factor domain-containing protein [Candidatus Dormibacteraceae bacterium]
MPEKTLLPLASDTAAIYPKWSIDWLSVTVFGIEPNEVAAIASEAFHGGVQVRLDGWSEQGGASFYRNRYEYLGASLLYGCFSEGAEENVHIKLPGKACQRIGVDGLLTLIDRLQRRAARYQVVRLDLTVDDVPFTPQDAYQAVKENEVISWAKRGRDGLVSHSWVANNGRGEGNTLYIGRRSSPRCLRIYDKRGPTRIELEIKREQAQAIAKELGNLRWCDERQAELVMGCLREFCDFATQDGLHGIRGAELVPWWQEFVGSTERIGKLVSKPSEDLSVDRVLRWIDRAVTPSLAVITRCYGLKGRSMLNAWIEDAGEKLKPHHQAVIREFEYAYGKGEFKEVA